MELRKDIYLGAAEASAAGYSAVGKFADFRMKLTKLQRSSLRRRRSLRKSISLQGQMFSSDKTSASELNAVFNRFPRERVVGFCEPRT